jgi:hypothetical protein
MEMVNTIRHTLMMVSGETTVPVGFLLEDDDFMEYLQSGKPEFTDLLNWVNENY